MNSKDDRANFIDCGDKGMLLHASGFALVLHSWAHMFGAGLILWADTSLTAVLVALQCFYPFNFGPNGVAAPVNDEFKDIMFARQDAKGFFSPCTVWVHNVTGATILTTVHQELVHLEPGFMAPLPPIYLCFA